MAAILRIQRPVDPNDRLFNIGGVIVSKSSLGRLALTVGRNSSILDRANVIALSNKLHEWLNETAPDVDWAAIAFNGPEHSEMYVPDPRAEYLAEQQAAATGKEFQPTEIERNRFADMCAGEYSRVMNGGEEA